MKLICSFLLAFMLVLPFHMNGQANASDSKVADTINKTDANGDKTGFWI